MMLMNTTTLSPKLRAAIRAHTGQQWRLAQSVGVHPSTLSNWLSGAVRPRPWDSRVTKLGALLGLAPDECIDESGEAHGSQECVA